MADAKVEIDMAGLDIDEGDSREERGAHINTYKNVIIKKHHKTYGAKYGKLFKNVANYLFMNFIV